MLAAYADTRQDGDYPGYSTDYLRQVVSAEADAQAVAFDEAIGQWLATPGATQSFSAGNQLPVERYDHARLNEQLVQLLRHFGAHSRNYVRAGLDRPAQ